MVPSVTVPPCLAPRLQTAKLLVLFAILQQEHVVAGHNTGIPCMSQPACRRPPSRSASRILAGRLSRPTIGERRDARNIRDGFRVGFPYLLAGKHTLGIHQSSPLVELPIDYGITLCTSYYLPSFDFVVWQSSVFLI